MKHCINQTTQGCVLSGDCRCTKQLEDNSYDGYLQSSVGGKTKFGVSYTLKGLIEDSNETH